MECPKCGLEIDDKAMVCPNCKKVLKLACPICKTINDSNTCKKCGYVIISKCYHCGKINQTFSKKCKKCGFDTEKSVIINESNTDDFAIITFDFPNLDDMKRLLGSAKLFNKFKINLDKIFSDYTKSKGLRRQIIGKTYVIRCNKDYTFNSSVKTAIQTVIDLLNLITSMNCKLSSKKDATLKCNVFILKRSTESDPENIDSGFNINLLNQNTKSKEQKILNTFQVLIDDFICDVISGDYKVSPINSILVEDTMIMISEVDLKEFIKVEYPQEDDEDEIKIPNFVQNMLIEQDKLGEEALNHLNSNKQDEIYDIETINFEEIKCEFLHTENVDLIFHIMNILQTKPKGILAVKTLEMYKPYTLNVLNAVAKTGQFNNIITLTCHDEMKYTPYSFFRDLISAIFEYSVSQKLFDKNDFSMFNSIDPEGLIKDLINLQKRETENAENDRFVYFDIFMTLMQIIPKTLIYVEDFEKIDSSSYDVLKYLFKSFEELDVSFLLSYDKNFSLHKDCHFLLMQPYYTEIQLTPASFEKLIEDNKVYYRNILDNFYFQRIAKYSCGSSLFIDLAIQYLVEEGVYKIDDDCVEMINPKTIIVPSSLDKLVARRLNLLQDDVDTMKFFTSLILLGTRIDIETAKIIAGAKYNSITEKLTNAGFIYEYNNCIYFPNYNLVKRNLINTLSKIYIEQISKDLFQKVFVDNMPSSTKAYLFNLLGDLENEQAQWEQLADINLSLGDYNSYINCVDKVLKILNSKIDEDGSIAEYKSQLYEKISENLYIYNPELNSEIAAATLENIEKTADTEKIIQLCNKIIDGALLAGDYAHALELTHKVLGILPASSINPTDENFNKYFFLMSLIHIQILFNIGALSDCMNIGYKVLNVVTNDTLAILKPDYYSDENFQNLILDSIGFVALANVLMLNGNVADFLNILRNELNFIPKSYDIFIALQDLLHGNEISVDISIENDKFSPGLANIINAILNFDGNYNSFAEHIYISKIAAKENNFKQLELFSDILISYAYMQIESYRKAENILHNIIKETNKNGMTNILYIAWYIMAELHLKQNKYDIAFGIVNNSLIQIEKNNTISEYLLLLFKYSMYKIMMFKKEYEKAEICINQARYLAAKYSINFNFDTDTNNYISVEEDSIISAVENLKETPETNEDDI